MDQEQMNRSANGGRPPGPRDWTFGIQILARLRRDILGFYRELHSTYGDVVCFRTGPFHNYVFFHPEQIREITVTKAKDFTRMWRQVQVLSQWNGNSVIISDGDTWLRQRRLIQGAFGKDRFAGYAGQIVRATLDACDAMTMSNDIVEFDKAMTDLTTSIICRTMFGSDLGEKRAELRCAVEYLAILAVQEMMALFSTPAWPILPGMRAKQAAIATIDQAVRGFIRDRRASSRDEGDLLSMLLAAVDHEGDGRGLTDAEARDQCVAILLAGHDTTAAGLTWVGWMLAAHPEIAARAKSEVDEILKGREPAYVDVAKLAYLEQVVKESLRCYPPAIALFGRQAAKDTQIGDWRIPKGALLYIVTYQTHHDPRWFPEPEKFDPDRFGAGRIEQIPPGAYIPFGLGPRTCIGNHFAMMEMVLAVAVILQRFSLQVPDGAVSPELSQGMSLRPRGGMKLRLLRR